MMKYINKMERFYENNSFAIKLILVILISMAAFGGGFMRIGNNTAYEELMSESFAGSDIFRWFFAATMLAILALVIVAYFMIYRFHVAPCNLYFVAGVVLGLVYMMVIPVFAVPDEPSHAYTAYEISNRMLGIPASEDGIILVRSDDAANGFGHVGITRNYYDQYYARLKNVFVENGELVSTIQNTISVCPYFYYISAVGLTVGRLLHFGTLQVFLLGRLCNLLMFVLAVYYSIKKIPFGKTVLFLWALLPITLQQTMSYSYDAPILALSVVVISLSLRLAYVKSEQTKKSEWVILFICTVLLFPAKSFAITPICMLPFMIYFRKHQEGKKILRYIGLLLAGMFVFAILLKAMSQGTPTADTGNLISWANEPGYTLGYLLKNPKRLFELLCNTIYLNGDFYVESFLGNSLGWLNLNIPLFAVIPYLVMLVLAGMRREGEPLYLGRKAKMYLCFLAVIGIGFAFAGMLLNWTPISYNWIEGVQGRYFLPFAVLFFLSVRSDKITVDKQVDNKLIFSGIWLQMLVLLFLFISVC